MAKNLLALLIVLGMIGGGMLIAMSVPVGWTPTPTYPYAISNASCIDAIPQIQDNSVKISLWRMEVAHNQFGSYYYRAFVRLDETNSSGLHESVPGMGTFWKTVSWHEGAPYTFPDDPKPSIIDPVYNTIPSRADIVDLPSAAGSITTVEAQVNVRVLVDAPIACSMEITRQ